jgi:hypothetical protein
VAAREGVDGLVAAWDDALYEMLAASNLSLDVPRERRKKELADLRASHGACRPDGALVAENALRGSWRLACDRGRIRLSLTLAPTEPPRIQALSAVSALPLAPALQSAAERLAARLGVPAPTLDDILAPDVDRAPIARSAAAASAWGSCRAGEVREGAGEKATIRLSCDKGSLDAQLVLDATSGRLRSLKLSPASADACVP